MKISELRFFGFDGIPEHMAELSEVARSLGLSRGALLRMMIVQYLRKEQRRNK